jgi:outer membrane protein TolC
VRILRRGADAAQESRDLVEQLYRGGRADFNRVFVAEFFLVQQQDALAQAEGSVARSLVEIYRSLGGGWQIRLEPLPAMAAVEAEVVQPEAVAPDMAPPEAAPPIQLPPL